MFYFYKGLKQKVSFGWSELSKFWFKLVSFNDLDTKYFHFLIFQVRGLTLTVDHKKWHFFLKACDIYFEKECILLTHFFDGNSCVVLHRLHHENMHKNLIENIAFGWNFIIPTLFQLEYFARNWLAQLCWHLRTKINFLKICWCFRLFYC